MTALKCLQANLKRLRKEQGYTQQALAEHAGMDYKYYQRIEAGNWPGLQLRTVDRLAKTLRVEVAELFRRP